ncbi:MAG: hypothetical protein KAJ95_00570, partial [Gammaproteobacteria bacterium]|nr:hypothetical protein [Gammaproteobacteria bacterium]
MLNNSFRTPLIAAFFCAAIMSGCTQDQTASGAGYAKCKIQSTPIASIQGSFPASKVVDKQVTIQGIVVLVRHGQGLYIEEPGSDNDDGTSNAIFVQTANMPTGIGPGAWISASGKVTEIPKGRYSLTALTDVSEFTRCSSAQTLPLTNVSLPLKGLEREAFEGMRIQVNGELTVADTYGYGDGRFSLAGNGFQFVATEVSRPGPEAPEYTQRNRNFTLAAMLPKDATRPALLSTGTSIGNAIGVLEHDARSLRLTLQSITVKEPAAFNPPPQAEAGDLRVVGMNLHNFFNGDGKGGDFPTSRGAKTAAEFADQRKRLGAAIGVLNPHVLAVQELENDGFGPLSAATDFIALAKQVTGASWQFARPVGEDTGTDKITVGLFYRDDLLETVGTARTLTGPEFKKSRQPMAQVF